MKTSERRENKFHLGKTAKNRLSPFKGPMAEVERALVELASDASVGLEVAGIPDLLGRLSGAADAGEAEAALIALYSRLHGAGAGYTDREKARLQEIEGYGAISSGIEPLLAALDFIGPGSTVADLGAGNGLQGLLLERISPHRMTLQIELSSEMLRIGRLYQRALGIGDERIRWIHGDILDVSLDEADFVYIYRPARPVDAGREFYEKVARKLCSVKRPLTVLSVADCLGEFLEGKFRVVQSDGHVTCFRNE